MVLSPFLIISYFVDRRFKFNFDIFDFRAKTPLATGVLSRYQTSGQRQRVVSFEEAASRDGRLF